MASDKAAFTFNSAISGVDPDEGKWDEHAHRTLIKPLRGRIMQIDGVTGVFIARYALEVDYLAEVINLDKLENHVHSAVNWAAEQDGFFPLRGDKTVAATSKRPRITQSISRKIVVQFNSSLIKLPVGQSGGFDRSMFNKQTRDMVQKLVDFDGVTDCELRMYDGVIFFNGSITDERKLIHHVTTQLLAGADVGFFPYSGGSHNVRLQGSVHNN